MERRTEVKNVRKFIARFSTPVKIVRDGCFTLLLCVCACVRLCVCMCARGSARKGVCVCACVCLCVWVMTLADGSENSDDSFEVWLWYL